MSQEDPPDILVMAILPNYEKHMNEMQWRELEVMKITKHTNEEIDQEILKTLKNKVYIKQTGLVVYLNRTVVIDDMRMIAGK